MSSPKSRNDSGKQANCGLNMVTFSGRYVDPDNLKPGDIVIEDVAHGLSNCCRYGGQCREFYSVAQHSTHMAHQVYLETESMNLARIALMHDAPEAYCGDLVRCIKHHAGADYADLEYAIWMAVVEEFKLEPFYSLLKDGEDVSELPKEVHDADMRMCITERRDIILEQDTQWDLERVYKPYDFPIVPMIPSVAERYFHVAYQQYFWP
jgi:hypothetical protein